MTLATFDNICRSLPGAKMAVQWGESHVWKVAGKMFAMGNHHGVPSVIFKTTPLTYEILLQTGIASRAPYLPRGNWVRVSGIDALPGSDLADHLATSHRLVSASLTKAVRESLGIG